MDDLAGRADRSAVVRDLWDGSHGTHAPGQYGRPAWAAYFEKWIKQGSERLPEMVGVIEAKLR